VLSGVEFTVERPARVGAFLVGAARRLLRGAAAAGENL
jgi:hypothetical protein